LPANTTFSTDSFSTLSFANAVGGSASLTKIGAGTLALAGREHLQRRRLT